LGYFDKIHRADVFVVLDNVQFPKTGGTWINRVMLDVGRKSQWITAPVIRSFHGVRRIDEVQFNESTPWREQFIRALETNYGRAPGFGEAFSKLLPLISNKEVYLSKYNLNAIHAISSMLGVDSKKFVLASSLRAHGNATHLLIALTRAVNGTAYLTGGGASEYLRDELFAQAGLTLIHQNFRHPHYPQKNQTVFLEGLSIIDALLNLGVEKTRELLHAETC